MRRKSCRWWCATACAAAFLFIPAEAGRQDDPRSFSPRLGIFFEMVDHGARLTENPAPGSPLRQGQIVLERGDVITRLDDLIVDRPAELENHHAETTVAFINIRTHKSEERTVYLPPMGALPVPRPDAPRDDFGINFSGPRYSQRLGLFTEPVNHEGRAASRLTSPPVPGSPMAQEQVALETGDVILQIDDLPAATALDLERHYARTSVVVAVRKTGRVETRWAYLPVLDDPGVPKPPEVIVLPEISEVPGEMPALFPLPGTTSVAGDAPQP